LSSGDALPSGGAHFPPGFRNTWCRAFAVQQLTEFVNLGVEAPFLRFETFNRGMDDLSCELLRHLNGVVETILLHACD
jgi:hypothetical protein